MNRICLKRKQMNRQANLNQPESQNIQSTKSLQSSLFNTPVKPTATQPAKKASDFASTTMKFQQFHKQYDEMRLLYEQKRKDYDEVIKEKKRLEIQLMNCNSQHYEKQIKRLKEEVEKFQEENEDHKHKYIMAENSKKEFEASAKVRAEDLKKALQQLEKEKISCVELRYQITQKDKSFQRVTAEMEKSSQVLSKNFEEITMKYKKLENSFKTKNSQLQNYIKNCEFLEKKLNESEKLAAKNKEIFDQTNFKKTQMIQDLQNKLRIANKTSRDTIEDLEFKIQEIKNQRKTQNLLVDQRIENVASLKVQRKNELEIVRLQEINKQLKADYNDKCCLLRTLEQKIKQSYSKQQYAELQQANKNLKEEILQIRAEDQKKLTAYEKQIQQLKIHLEESNRFIPQQESNHPGNEFKQILKTQLEQNTRIRSELNKKIEELFNCKSDADDMKCKLRASQAQITIYQKKIKSLEKNHRIHADVSEQNMKNEIDSLKRKIQMLNTKLENKVREVKEKQGFIINTIIGRSKQEDVPLILAELQRIFETQYSCKLSAANNKIEELENQLKKYQE